MKIEFEFEFLKFLAQHRKAKKFIPSLDNEIFVQLEHRFLFQLVADFYKKYNDTPALPNLSQLFYEACQKKEVSAEIVTSVERSLVRLYEPINGSLVHLKEHLIDFVQNAKVKEFYMKHAGSFGVFDQKTLSTMRRELGQIQSIVSRFDEEELEDSATSFFDSDDFDYLDIVTNATPTFISKLNSMMSAGGFHAPQLGVLMGLPKAFKTGIGINLAMGLVKQGKHVYWADLENGAEAIKIRVAQYMLNCKEMELLRNRYDEDTEYSPRELLQLLSNAYKNLGGSVHIKTYEPNATSFADIEADMQLIEQTQNIKFDAVINDYIDLMRPASVQKELRLNISQAYIDAKGFCFRNNVFCLTFSHSNRDGFKKEVLDLTNITEDFKKAAHADFILTISQTLKERAANVARLSFAAIRKGLAYDGTNNTIAYLKLDYERQKVYEIDINKASHLVSEAEIRANNPHYDDV